MADLMGLLIETLANSIVLACKPLFLIKLVFLLGVRTAVFVTLAWLRLLKAIICFPVNVCLGIIHWTIALALLPIRILNAFQKEKVVSPDWLFSLNKLCEVIVFIFPLHIGEMSSFKYSW